MKVLTCWPSAANQNLNMLGLCCKSNLDMLGLYCASTPELAGPVPLLSGLGCLFGVWMHLLVSVSLLSGFWTHVSDSVTLLAGSGCSLWSVDWRLHLVEPGLCSAGTGLRLQTQAAGEPLHTHQHMWLHEVFFSSFPFSRDWPIVHCIPGWSPP